MPQTTTAPPGALFYLPCNECGAVVFYMAKRPKDGDPLRPDGCWLPDGTKPTTGTRLDCWSCGNLHVKLDPDAVLPVYGE